MSALFLPNLYGFFVQASVARGEARAEEVEAEGLLQDPGGGEERQR
jgi:hypothetical protein